MIGLADVQELDALSAAVSDALAPDAVPLPDAVAMWELFDAVERRAAAMKTLMAPRVDQSRAWQRAGHRNAAEFLAERGGTSISAARTQLEVAQKLGQLPAIQQAVRDGEYSAAQVALVVEGASVDPGAEQRLLDQAARGSLKELRDEVLRVRAAADPDPDTTQRRIHERRHFRTWRDGEGAWRASLYGTAVTGARVQEPLHQIVHEKVSPAKP